MGSYYQDFNSPFYIILCINAVNLILVFILWVITSMYNNRNNYGMATIHHLSTPAESIIDSILTEHLYQECPMIHLLLLVMKMHQKEEGYFPHPNTFRPYIQYSRSNKFGQRRKT